MAYIAFTLPDASSSCQSIASSPLPTNTMQFFFLLALFFASTYAHITGIVPSTATYKPSSTSTHHVIFKTVTGPTTYDDYTVVFGISGKDQTLSPEAFGTFVEVYDLLALGYKATVRLVFLLA